jgi:chemotaxis protein methyltransferase WspC
MKHIEDLLRETMGLDAASIGSALIHRTARLRMKSLGIKRVELYRELLVTSRAEWDELVESVVVRESWFFRDREPFTALVDLVMKEWLPAHPTAPLRLLSLPCASGEEPYSLAMALQDAGLSSGRFQIDAADISGRALAQGRTGSYRKNSFRCLDLAFRDRHFLAVKDGFLLKPALRQGVNFYQWNILAGDFPANLGPYDFIFCRNLLIYFDRVTQQKALNRIKRLLSPAGVLFVGPAEVPLVLEQGFVSAGIPLAFACRKAASTAAVRAAREQQAARPPTPTPTPVRAGSWNLNGGGASIGNTLHAPFVPLPARRDREKERTSADTAPAGLGHASLQTARQHADAGRLKEAAAICENHLRERGASAEAYYLLGLVLDAQSISEAIDCYRKALYLEPDHYETLLQMAFLSQRNGDSVRADSFKRRARKVSESMSQ